MVSIILLMTESNLMFAQSNAHYLSNTITSFKVVANVPSWSASEDALPLNKVTHIQYSSVRPTLTGGLTLLDNPQKLKDIVTKAHSKNVLVGISVGGWSDFKRWRLSLQREVNLSIVFFR
jgi:GH18 family chitinase